MAEDQTSQNLTVAVRVRPLSATEQKRKVAKVVQSSGNRVIVTHGPGGRGPDRTYNYDRVFSPYAAQEHVFESLVSPVVDEVLRGFNCTVFAYGPTGTGKTHTMEGTADDAGLAPRCAKALFARLEKQKTKAGEADFQIKASCLEIYNEELSDLFAVDDDTNAQKTTSAAMALHTKPNPQKRPLRLVEAANKSGVTCANLEEVVCGDVDSCLKALQKGANSRRIASTKCNDKSSRSHALYTLKVCVRSLTEDGRDLIVNGQLNLVDLAGSECVGRSGATDKRAREAGSINQSLLTLGRVITALVSAGESKYVPYRDSKLTRLLQDSLGGKAKTTLIATVAPGKDCVEETLSTLQYALRARSIQNRPEQHARYHGKAIVRAHAREVDELQRLLACQREKNGGIYVDGEQWESMQGELASRKAELEELGEELQNARIQALEAEKKLDDAREEADAQRELRVVAEKARDEALEGKRLAEEAHRAEVKAHADTKKVLEAHQRNERVLLQNGALLKGHVREAAQDLDASAEELQQWRRALDDTVTKCKATASSLSDERRPALVEAVAALEAALERQSKDAEQARKSLETGASTALQECVDALREGPVASLCRAVRAAAAEDLDLASQRRDRVATMMRDAVAGINKVQKASETMSDNAKDRAQRVAQILNEARQALERAKAQMEESGASLMERAAEGAEKVIDSVKPCVSRLDEAAAARRSFADAREIALQAFRAQEAEARAQRRAELEKTLAAWEASSEDRAARFAESLKQTEADASAKLVEMDDVQRTALSTLSNETVPAFVAELQGDVTKLVERCGDDLDAVSGDLPLDQVAAFQSDLDGAAVASVAAAASKAGEAASVEAGDRDARETEACGAARITKADALMETAAEAARAAGQSLAGACEASAAAAADAAASAQRASKEAAQRHAVVVSGAVDAAASLSEEAAATAAARAEASVPREGAPHVARSDSVALDPTPPAAQILAADAPPPAPPAAAPPARAPAAENVPPAAPPVKAPPVPAKGILSRRPEGLPPLRSRN